MSFNDVALDERCVARSCTLRHSVLCFEIGQLRIFGEIDAGSKIL